MNKPAYILMRRFPKLFQRMEIQILLNTAAKAFGKKAVMVMHKDPSAALAAYAEYTRRCMDSCNVSKERLYKYAYALGTKVRRYSGCAASDELHALLFDLYRNIGIAMTGDIKEELIISRCYFSRIYTPDHCAVMSATDAGIIAGLFGEGTLSFSQRITEGCSECRACFARKDEQ